MLCHLELLSLELCLFVQMTSYQTYLVCQTLVAWHVWAFEGQLSHPELTSPIQKIHRSVLYFSCHPPFPAMVATDYWTQHNTIISFKREFWVCTLVILKQMRVFLILIWGSEPMRVAVQCSTIVTFWKKEVGLQKLFWCCWTIAEYLQRSGNVASLQWRG